MAYRDRPLVWAAPFSVPNHAVGCPAYACRRNGSKEAAVQWRFTTFEAIGLWSAKINGRVADAAASLFVRAKPDHNQGVETAPKAHGGPIVAQPSINEHKYGFDLRGRADAPPLPPTPKRRTGPSVHEKTRPSCNKHYHTSRTKDSRGRGGRGRQTRCRGTLCAPRYVTWHRIMLL